MLSQYRFNVGPSSATLTQHENNIGLTSRVAGDLLGGGPWWLAPLPFTPEFGVRFPFSAVWKKQKMFLPHVKVSIVESLRDQEVAWSASDCQGSNFESCVRSTVSSQSSHHPQEVLLAQFSLYVHKGGLKPDSFHFGICLIADVYLI